MLVDEIGAVHLNPVAGPLDILDGDFALAHLTGNLGQRCLQRSVPVAPDDERRHGDATFPSALQLFPITRHVLQGERRAIEVDWPGEAVPCNKQQALGLSTSCPLSGQYSSALKAHTKKQTLLISVALFAKQGPFHLKINTSK